MKITKTQLKRIIKEELEQVLVEFDPMRALKKGALALMAPSGIDAASPASRIDNYAALSNAYEALTSGDKAAAEEAMEEVHLLWDQYKARTATIEKETAKFLEQIMAAYEKFGNQGALTPEDINSLESAYGTWKGPVAKLRSP